MNNVEDLRKLLLSYDLTSVELVESRENENAYHAFVIVQYDNFGNRIPSDSTIRRVRKQLDSLELDVDLVIVDPDWDNLNRILKTRVLREFSKYIEYVHLRQEYRKVIANVRISKDIDTEISRSISDLVRQFLILTGHESNDIIIDTIDDFPSLTTILANLRTIAPCFIEHLEDRLRTSKFAVPSTKWLNRRLDELRRKGFVLRNSNGEFFLTFEGLNSLGTRKDSSSPDVRRALAMARKESII